MSGPIPPQPRVVPISGAVVSVRVAQTEDAARIAALCRQLGYSTTVQEVLERLGPLTADPARRVLFVADLEAEPVAGWVSVAVTESLLTGKRAEIDGLIVDERFRGKHLGSILMKQAEEWAKQRECIVLQVRSNTIRTQAHAFYQKHSFRALKTQVVLRKALSDG